jgi:hypothetical protein
MVPSPETVLESESESELELELEKETEKSLERDAPKVSVEMK